MGFIVWGKVKYTHKSIALPASKDRFVFSCSVGWVLCFYMRFCYVAQTRFKLMILLLQPS